MIDSRRTLSRRVHDTVRTQTHVAEAFADPLIHTKLSIALEQAVVVQWKLDLLRIAALQCNEPS
jgi:hypothetical protein